MRAQSTLPKFFTSSLGLVATNYALRCDAKYADDAFLKLESRIRKGGFFELGDFLPTPFVKGVQPDYLDSPAEDSVPVINTLSIQNLSIHANDCRHMSREDFKLLTSERRLIKGDVLLTMDGGVSIGKPAYFDLKGEFTADSHVCMLRPKAISPLGLVYLLASPIGQLQFRRAESGASGQTAVTEEDVRRFIFPASVLSSLDSLVKEIEKERSLITKARLDLEKREACLWHRLEQLIA